MSPMEFICKDLNLVAGASLEKVTRLLDQGMSVGEVCYDESIWSDKDYNYWKVDRIERSYKKHSKLKLKKEKYTKDIETRQEPPSGVVEKIAAAGSLEDLEDIFRPYKRKKKTKATLAREAGLQAFADELKAKAQSGETLADALEVEAKKYIQPALGFITYETVLKGVQDILVEQGLSDFSYLRKNVLDSVLSQAKVSVKAGDKFSEGGRYSNFVKSEARDCAYYLNPNNFDKFPAIKKAWEDGHLKVSLDYDKSENQKAFEEAFVGKASGDLVEFLKSCAKKAFEIHILPSVTTEVFDSFYSVSNDKYLAKLKLDYISLLTTPAFGKKPVLSFYEKNESEVALVFVSHDGKFISSTQIDLTADDVVLQMTSLLEGITKNLNIGALALPLGGQVRKLELFANKALEAIKKKDDVPVLMVDPRGLAQFVSSSEAKFGLSDKLDNTSLAAYRLARRLQSPILEYSDHLPSHLLETPNFMSKDEVNEELAKTLSYYICSFGLEPSDLSLGMMDSLGWFKSLVAEERSLSQVCQDFAALKASEKKDLEAFFGPALVNRLTKFFKFDEAVNLLDKSRLSIEVFPKVKDFLKDQSVSLLKGPLTKGSLKPDEKSEKTLGKEFIKYLEFELSQPFKDFRKPYKVFSFSKTARDLEEVQEENLYWGVVTKFTGFGAFVDIGVGVDGLIHLSELSNEYVGDPRKVLRLGQWVLVKAIKVDKEKKQLSFSKTQAEQKSKSFSKGKPKFNPKGAKPSRKRDGFKGGGKKPFKSNKGGKKPSQPFNNPFAALGDLNKN